MGSCRTIAAVEDTATRGEHSAGAGMRRRDCDEPASAPAGEADSTGGGHHAAFPDGKGRQVESSGPASLGRCGAVAFTPLSAGRRPSSQRVRQRGRELTRALDTYPDSRGYGDRVWAWSGAFGDALDNSCWGPMRRASSGCGQV